MKAHGELFFNVVPMAFLSFPWRPLFPPALLKTKQVPHNPPRGREDKEPHKQISVSGKLRKPAATLAEKHCAGNKGNVSHGKRKPNVHAERRSDVAVQQGVERALRAAAGTFQTGGNVKNTLREKPSC